VTLNGGEYEAYTRLDGSFVFYDVKPGIHLLDVLSPLAMFSQVVPNFFKKGHTAQTLGTPPCASVDVAYPFVF
jgi:hypothetical protein